MTLVCKRKMTSALKIAAVLVQRPVGSALCSKCNELNLVRDNIFQCYCGFTANVIDCACECGNQLLDRDGRGNLRQFLHGHSSRGKIATPETREKMSLSKVGKKCGKYNSHWSGGRTKSLGYWLVKICEHRYADRHGYVREHRLVIEDSRNCCLLPWAHVHHRDGNKENNVWYNLRPMMNVQHMSLHGRPRKVQVNDLVARSDEMEQMKLV